MTPCGNTLIGRGDAIGQPCRKQAFKRLTLTACPACHHDPGHSDDLSGALCLACTAQVARIFNEHPHGWTLHACCSRCHQSYTARAYLAPLPSPHTSSPPSEQTREELDTRPAPQVWHDTLGLAKAWASDDREGAHLAISGLTAPEAHATVELLLALAINTWTLAANERGWPLHQLLEGIFTPS